MRVFFFEVQGRWADISDMVSLTPVVIVAINLAIVTLAVEIHMVVFVSSYSLVVVAPDVRARGAVGRAAIAVVVGVAMGQREHRPIAAGVSAVVVVMTGYRSQKSRIVVGVETRATDRIRNIGDYMPQSLS